MKLKVLFVLLVLLLAICCAAQAENPAEITQIFLSDDGVLVNGEPAPADPERAVYTANDIVYYESGKDFTYGEGSESDAHDPESAAAHTVVHITQPGAYALSGTLSKGQIAVDLGSDAKDDPEAVVTLILDGADITCEVAPAVIFYNVYECGSKDEETASKDADTSAAGANIIIADGSENVVSGSYVADIYDPESVVLNEDKTEVEDADKLHSYDGAVYSRMSMNVDGGDNSSGLLQINADNEGLCSELHLTVNGGRIEIHSGNDGVNANEDNLSVVTVNGGELLVQVTGETGEGDGIDSNGWIVINDGAVYAFACESSADAGVDADKGIHINGGTVAAGGHMFDRIEDGGQNYAVFSFAQEQKGGAPLTFRGENNRQAEILSLNNYSILIYSSPDLEAGEYTLWSGDVQLAGRSVSMDDAGMGKPGEMPENWKPDWKPEDMPEMPRPPEGMPDFERMERPGEKPGEGWKGGRDFGLRGGEAAGELTAEFEIKAGANMFSGIEPAE